MDELQLKRAIAEISKTAGTVPGANTAFAELIIEYIQPNHLSLDIFNRFMRVVQRNLGDQYVRKVRKGRYPVRAMVPGTDHLADVTTYQDQYHYVFDRLVAGVLHNLWEVRSGEVGTVESIRSELRADLFDEIVSRIFTLLSTVWNGTDTPNNYADASATGVTATVLNTMIENVLEYTGGIRAIVGPRKALMPIYNFAQYKEFVLTGTGTDRVAFPTSAFTEFNNSNIVSTYLGYPLIEVPQVFRNRLPDMRERMIPTDKILVIGDNAGEIVLQGSTEFQESIDTSKQPPYWKMHCWQAFGVVVDNVEAIGVIKTNT